MFVPEMLSEVAERTSVKPAINLDDGVSWNNLEYTNRVHKVMLHRKTK
jgi:hypothetical protein